MIYESPDGGETVYVRKFGSTEKTLHNMSERARELLAETEEKLRWEEIRTAAKSNPALQKAIERAIIIYELGKEYGQTST